MTEDERREAMRLEIMAGATPEYLEEQLRAEREMRYNLAELPKKLRGSSSDTIPDTAEYKTKIDRWRWEKWPEARKSKSYPRGLFLRGHIGSGKTTIAGGLLRSLLDVKASGFFVLFTDLFDISKNPTMIEGTDDTDWSVMHRTGVLVIDDLGAGVNDKFGQIGLGIAESLIRLSKLMMKIG